MNTYPSCGIRAKVGFRPTTPQRAAGILTDPEANITSSSSTFSIICTLNIRALLSQIYQTNSYI